MAIIGYRRISSGSQRFDSQSIGPVDRMFDETWSGKDAKSRPELQACMAYLREGDTLRVFAVDRLARSLVDLLTIVEDLNSRGVAIEFMRDGMTFDPESKDPLKKAMLSMVGVFSSLEREIIEGRRNDGIAAAKARGVYTGRKKALSDAQIREAKLRRNDGVPISRIARDLGVTELTMSRALRGLGAYAS